MNAGSPHAPRDQPEKEREKEREREREREKEEETRGDQASARPKSFIFQQVHLYLALYIEGNERCKVIQSQPKHSSSFALIKTRIFSANLSHKQYCVHYLLALEAYEPSFDKGFSTRKLIYPQSVFSSYF